MTHLLEQILSLEKVSLSTLYDRDITLSGNSSHLYPNWTETFLNGRLLMIICRSFEELSTQVSKRYTQDPNALQGLTTLTVVVNNIQSCRKRLNNLKIATLKNMEWYQVGASGCENRNN